MTATTEQAHRSSAIDRQRLNAARDCMDLMQRSNPERFELIASIADLGKFPDLRDDDTVLRLRAAQFCLIEVERFRKMVDRIRARTRNPDAKLSPPYSPTPRINDMIVRALDFTYSADRVLHSERVRDDEAAAARTVRDPFVDPDPEPVQRQATFSELPKRPPEPVASGVAVNESDPSTWADGNDIPF